MSEISTIGFKATSGAAGFCPASPLPYPRLCHASIRSLSSVTCRTVTQSLACTESAGPEWTGERRAATARPFLLIAINDGIRVHRRGLH